MSEIVLEIDHISKRFGPTVANNDVCLQFRRGEVHALIGENGCGKSTLMSIIAGMQPMDSGHMLLRGQPYQPLGSEDAIESGIGMVVQELGLLDRLPAYVNMFCGRLKPFTRGGVINLKKMKAAAQEHMTRWGLPRVNLSKHAGELSVEEKKIIELARALSIDPDVLILDELTQALSHDTREILYGIIQSCKDSGKAVLVISHDLEEIVSLVDTITVMRDGEIVTTLPAEDATVDELKRMMVGRALNEHYYRTDCAPVYGEDVVLSVRDLADKESGISDVSFDLHAGEILAICGLSDAGIHTVGKMIFGVQKPDKGSITALPDNKHITSPQKAVAMGIGYQPKDRDMEGLMIGASIRDNLCFPSVHEIERKGTLLPARLNAYAEKASRRFEVKSTGIQQVLNSLSGGNKQKVNLGRWMSKDLKILILDCPTRGVDVGVKAYIYETMQEFKAQGLSMVLISDELPEALGLADRIMVMKNGRINAILERGQDFTEEKVIEVMV